MHDRRKLSGIANGGPHRRSVFSVALALMLLCAAFSGCAGEHPGDAETDSSGEASVVVDGGALDDDGAGAGTLEPTDSGQPDVTSTTTTVDEAETDLASLRQQAEAFFEAVVAADREAIRSFLRCDPNPIYLSAFLPFLTGATIEIVDVSGTGNVGTVTFTVDPPLPDFGADFEDRWERFDSRWLQPNC